jgi:hypothetical protein
MEKQVRFTVQATNDKIWNLNELLRYLNTQQNKNIALEINPEAIDCKNLGLYNILESFKFSQVEIYTRNMLESHPTYTIIKYWGNKWLTHVPKIHSDLHQWNQEKVFLSFYRRPSANRIGLASYLYAKYPDQSIVHFSSGTNSDNLQLFEFDKLAEYDVNSFVNVAKLLPHLPLRFFSSTPKEIKEMNQFILNYDNFGVDMYKNIFVDVVSETHVIGKTFYPTEKTSRPIWLKKPFIAFASVDYLEYLRQIGFKTFSDFWDETYDGYSGTDRYKKILSLIDSIAAKSKKELEDMYCDMQYVLDHNFNLLKTQMYKKEITLVE